MIQSGYVRYILPKSVTSVAVSGGRNEALKKLQLWINEHAAEVEWKSTSLKFTVPTGTNRPKLQEIENLLGEHRVSGGIGPVGSNKLVAEFWEYEMTTEQVQEVIEILNSKKFDSLQPTVFLSCYFRMKINGVDQYPKSSFLIGLEVRSYVMPDIVFPPEAVKDHFTHFSETVPFKVNPKYLRLVHGKAFRKLGNIF